MAGSGDRLTRPRDVLVRLSSMLRGSEAHMFPPFFTQRPEWLDRVGRIYAALDRLEASTGTSADMVDLRRRNRLEAVHSSTAIEGNRLTLDQVTAVIGGQHVYAPEKDVHEVLNAWAAYEALNMYDPWNVRSLLSAHGLLMGGLLPDAGSFRTVEVEIVNRRGDVLHTGSRAEKVPRLIAELLEWGSESDQHPLVLSSAIHFMIEQIHPFRDGNGRIGRLWQTLILSTWNPLFAWMPTETLIHDHQPGYYRALQASRDPEIDAAPFISFMLEVIEGSLLLRPSSGEGRFRENQTDDGISDEISDGINRGAATSSSGVAAPSAPPRLDAMDRQILDELSQDSTLTIAALATRLGKSSRTVERHLSKLSGIGLLTRQGSRKTGVWDVGGGRRH